MRSGGAPGGPARAASFVAVAIVLAGCGSSGDGAAGTTAAGSAATEAAASTAGTTPTRPAATPTDTTRADDASAAPRARPAPAPVVVARRLSPRVRERITGRSWRPGCPVPLADLRYLRIRYRGFDGADRRGEMIVHADAVEAVSGAFRTLYRERFPIRRMHLVERYDSDDHASIEADNTSSFNCRPVTGGSSFSQHAYGRAIDVNPLENPYVFPDGTTVHARSRPYLDRSTYRTGMARPGGTLVRAFEAVGWSWGGDWSSPKDLQHFSATGR